MVPHRSSLSLFRLPRLPAAERRIAGKGPADAIPGRRHGEAHPHHGAEIRRRGAERAPGSLVVLEHKAVTPIQPHGRKPQRFGRARRQGPTRVRILLAGHRIRRGVVGERRGVGAGGRERRVLGDEDRHRTGAGRRHALRPADLVHEVVKGGPHLVLRLQEIVGDLGRSPGRYTRTVTVVRVRLLSGVTSTATWKVCGVGLTTPEYGAGRGSGDRTRSTKPTIV